MVDLALVVFETVLRAGVPLVKNLKERYGKEAGYPDIYGMSVIFRPGWSLDQLAQAGHFPHPKLSYATVQQLRLALQSTGYDVQLTHTPYPQYNLPDHHTLSVLQGDVMLQSLPDDAAGALSATLYPNVIDNPYRQQNP